MEVNLATDTAMADTIRDMARALQGYPNDVAEEIRSDFFWIKQEVQNRPCFILAHRLVQLRPEGGLFAERQYYVGHNYNSLHLVAGAWPMQDGIIVFYRNRTSTDQVAGFGSGMKKGISLSPTSSPNAKLSPKVAIYGVKLAGNF